MKKVIIAVIVAIILSIPYIVGRMQHTNVVRVCQNMGNECNDDLGTDGEIENVLAVFNFDIGALDDPGFVDYYKAGFKTIIE